MGAFLFRLAFSTRANLLVAALLPVVLLGLILSIYFDIIDLDGVAQAIPIIEDKLELSQLGAHLANINNVLQGTISYILTIQLGIFLTIGFSFGITLQKGHTPSSFILLLHLIFLGCAVLSFHYGYAAYLLLAERIVAAYLDYGAVNSAIAQRAMIERVGAASSFSAAPLSDFSRFSNLPNAF